jgi:hypothetical protein
MLALLLQRQRRKVIKTARRRAYRELVRATFGNTAVGARSGCHR